jgi:hypothetical protein
VGGGEDQNMARGFVSKISHLFSTFLQLKRMCLLVEDSDYRGKRNKVNFYIRFGVAQYGAALLSYGAARLSYGAVCLSC